MRKVVVNSTPLIALSKAGNLNVLEKMYEHIIIPRAVFNEVTAKDDAVRTLLLQSSDWIEIQDIKDSSKKMIFKSRLHDGEVEVMILAEEIGADLVVIDDYAARKTAEYIGLKLTGTIGVLIKAKQNGLLDRVMPIVEIMEQNGIFYSEKLKQQIRNIVEE